MVQQVIPVNNVSQGMNSARLETLIKTLFGAGNATNEAVTRNWPLSRKGRRRSQISHAKVKLCLVGNIRTCEMRLLYWSNLYLLSLHVSHILHWQPQSVNELHNKSSETGSHRIKCVEYEISDTRSISLTNKNCLVKRLFTWAILPTKQSSMITLHLTLYPG